jgi:hypothetical protein
MGGWLGVYKAGVYDMGLHQQVHLGHGPKVFREPIRGFHDLLIRKPPFLDIVRVEYNLNSLPNNAVHISGSCGEGGRIVELKVVFVVITHAITSGTGYSGA